MPITLLDTDAAAEWLRLSPQTLRRKRCEGSGPRFVSLGSGKNSPVRYRLTDLEAWLVEADSTAAKFA